MTKSLSGTQERQISNDSARCHNALAHVLSIGIEADAHSALYVS